MKLKDIPTQISILNKEEKIRIISYLVNKVFCYQSIELIEKITSNLAIIRLATGQNVDRKTDLLFARVIQFELSDDGIIMRLKEGLKLLNPEEEI